VLLLQVRDRSLTPCTLLDAAEALPPITKNVVYLEIARDEAGQKKESQDPENRTVTYLWRHNFTKLHMPVATITQDECNLDVLKLVGNLLASKMSVHNYITHRGLIIISKTSDAEVWGRTEPYTLWLVVTLLTCSMGAYLQALLAAYNALSDNLKPQIRAGVPMVCATYYTGGDGPNGAKNELMEENLQRFKIISSPNPIHCLIQCQKLGEVRRPWPTRPRVHSVAPASLFVASFVIIRFGFARRGTTSPTYL
jgi:hypothetical protein